MAFPFFERGAGLIFQQRKERALVLVFGAVVLITALILWRGIFRSLSPRVVQEEGERVITLQLPELNLQVLKSEPFQKLSEPPAPKPLPATPGRENPFLPL